MDLFDDIINEHLVDPSDTVVRVEAMCLVRSGGRELARACDIWGGERHRFDDGLGWMADDELLEVTVPNGVAGALCALLEVRRPLGDGTSVDVTDETVHFTHLAA